MRDGTRTDADDAERLQGPTRELRDGGSGTDGAPRAGRQDAWPADVFDRVDALGSPRLVEYWEQDPCQGDTTYGVLLGNAVGEACRA